MAASLQLKLYTRSNKYIAAFDYPSDAAILLAALGEGTTLRYGHAKRDIVWHEGQEETSANESYDVVAEVVKARIHKILYKDSPPYYPKE